MIFKNHSMLDEIRSGNMRRLAVPAGHVCAVVLEELAREGKETTLDEFLGAWNKLLEGNWYAKVKKTELEDKVCTIALDMLTHLLLYHYKVSEKGYWKIIKEVHPLIKQ